MNWFKRRSNPGKDARPPIQVVFYTYPKLLFAWR